MNIWTLSKVSRNSDAYWHWVVPKKTNWDWASTSKSLTSYTNEKRQERRAGEKAEKDFRKGGVGGT